MSEDYSQTNDLYLQMLREAQRVEDRRLAAMILQRLKDNVHLSTHRENDNLIIPFPCPFIPSLLTPNDPSARVWPKNIVTHTLAAVAGYVALILTSYSFL